MFVIGQAFQEQDAYDFCSLWLGKFHQNSLHQKTHPTLLMNSQDASVRRFDFKTDFELDQVDIGKWVLHWIALQCFHETENYEYGRWHAKKGFLIDTYD